MIVGRQLYLKSLRTGAAADAAVLFPEANAAVTSYFQQLRASIGSWPAMSAVRLSLIGSAIDRLLREATDGQRKMVNLVFHASRYGAGWQ